MKWCQSPCISITQAACLFKWNSKSSQNRESPIPLPVHILIRLLKSIIESLRLCLQKLPKHLVVSISSIKDSAKSGGGNQSNYSSVQTEQQVVFFKQTVSGYSSKEFFSETRIQSIIPEGSCDFYHLMFGRYSDRSLGQNLMGMKMTYPCLWDNSVLI